MTIPQGLSIDKSPWSSTPPKDLVLQGIFARVGKKMKTQILLFSPLYIHCDLFIQTIAQICQHRTHHHFIHSHFPSNTAFSLSKPYSPLISSAASSLPRSILKFQEQLPGNNNKFLTTSDTVFIRNNLGGD